MRKVKISSFTILIFLFPILSADELLYMPSWSYFDPGLSYWGLTTNDGLGFDAGTDWDDGRTFGIAIGGAFDNWFAGIEAYSLTDRNNVPQIGRRTDELDVFGGYTFYFSGNDIFEQGVFSAGFDMRAFGNFNGMAFQGIYHGAFAEPRPLPETYTDPSFHVYPILAAEILLFTGINVRVRSIAGIDAMSFFTSGGPDWFASMGISQVIGGSQVQIEYGLRWNWNNVDGDTTEAGIADLEKGLWIDGKARMGFFYLERNLDLSTGNAAGGFGLMYGQPPLEKTETEGSVCFTYSIPVITVGFSSIIRYQPLWMHGNMDVFFSAANVNELMDLFVEPMVRTNIVTAGIEYFGFSLREDYLVNPFAFAQAGTQYSRNVTNDVSRCVNLNEYLVPVIHSGFGLRLCLADILPFWENVDLGNRARRKPSI